MIWLGLFELAVAGEACPACEPRMALAAARDLPIGTIIGEADLVGVQALPSELPPDTMGQPEFVVGRVVRMRVLAGEWMREARLADADTSSLSTFVPPGMRAMALPIDAPAGVVPGSRVDLIWTSPGRPACQVLSVLPVLGVGVASPVLVLALTPEWVALVGPIDPAQLTVVGRNDGDVFTTDVIAPCD